MLDTAKNSPDQVVNANTGHVPKVGQMVPTKPPAIPAAPVGPVFTADTGKGPAMVRSQPQPKMTPPPASTRTTPKIAQNGHLSDVSVSDAVRFLLPYLLMGTASGVGLTGLHKLHKAFETEDPVEDASSVKYRLPVPLKDEKIAQSITDVATTQLAAGQSGGSVTVIPPSTKDILNASADQATGWLADKAQTVGRGVSDFFARITGPGSLEGSPFHPDHPLFPTVALATVGGAGVGTYALLSKLFPDKKPQSEMELERLRREFSSVLHGPRDDKKAEQSTVDADDLTVAIDAIQQAATAFATDSAPTEKSADFRNTAYNAAAIAALLMAGAAAHAGYTHTRDRRSRDLLDMWSELQSRSILDNINVTPVPNRFRGPAVDFDDDEPKAATVKAGELDPSVMKALAALLGTALVGGAIGGGLGWRAGRKSVPPRSPVEVENLLEWEDSDDWKYWAQHLPNLRISRLYDPAKHRSGSMSVGSELPPEFHNPSLANQKAANSASTYDLIKMLAIMAGIGTLGGTVGYGAFKELGRESKYKQERRSPTGPTHREYRMALLPRPKEVPVDMSPEEFMEFTGLPGEIFEHVTNADSKHASWGPGAGQAWQGVKDWVGGLFSPSTQSTNQAITNWIQDPKNVEALMQNPAIQAALPKPQLTPELISQVASSPEAYDAFMGRMRERNPLLYYLAAGSERLTNLFGNLYGGAQTAWNNLTTPPQPPPAQPAAFNFGNMLRNIGTTATNYWNQLNGPPQTPVAAAPPAPRMNPMQVAARPVTQRRPMSPTQPNNVFGPGVQRIPGVPALPFGQLS